MKPLRRLFVSAAAVAVIVLMVTTVRVVFLRFSPPFDLALIQQLRWGMTEEEVQAILGPPTKKVGGTWVYANPGSWPRVNVAFDFHGTFARCNYDFF